MQEKTKKLIKGLITPKNVFSIVIAFIIAGGIGFSLIYAIQGFLYMQIAGIINSWELFLLTIMFATFLVTSVYLSNWAAKIIEHSTILYEILFEGKRWDMKKRAFV